MAQTPGAVEHEYHMRRCIELARKAGTAGETPVGAVIVRDGEVIGEKRESTKGLLDPSAHAEVQAIRAACQCENAVDLTGATLYATVEPCVMCAYVIRRCGIGTVVYGVAAGQLGSVTSQYAILTDTEIPAWAPPPIVISGILTDECLKALRRL